MTSKTIYDCGEQLNIAEAASLYAGLQDSLKLTSHVELKAADVAKADTAGLQLLVAFSRELAQTGGGLTWSEPSQALIETAALLGLDSELGLA